MSRIHCRPAFGKDYDSEDQVRCAWEKGVDFFMENRPNAYINIRDANKYGVPGGEINIRFKKITKVIVISGLKINPDM